MSARRGAWATTTVIAVLATVAGAPAVVQAADVRVSTNRFDGYLPAWSYIQFHAAPGEQNAVNLTRDGRTFVIADAGAPVRSPDGSCEVAADGASARCTVPEMLGGLDFELRDGDDRVRSDIAPGGPDNFDDPSNDYAFDGGPGDDVLTGSDLGDRLAGGAGNDRLSGRGGPDGLTDRAVDDVQGGESGGTNVMSGGEGDDQFGAGDGDDTMDGGPGADQMGFSGGTATATGGDGNDHFFHGSGGTVTIEGEGGDDTILRRAGHVDPERNSVAFDGGPGRDLVMYDFWEGSRYTARPSADDVGATIRLSSTETTTQNGLPGQSDSLTGVEDAMGSVGRDVLEGSDAANRLVGGTGADTIRGGAGPDALEGGPGGDAIDALDGEVDTVTCGFEPYRDAGDAVRSDAGDALSHCSDAPPPAEPADTTPPDVSGTRMPRTIKLARLRRRGVTVRLRSADASANRATAVLSTRGSRRLARRTRDFTGRAALKLRPRRGKLRRGPLRLTLQVRDAAGNVTTLRRTLRVR